MKLSESLKNFWRKKSPVFKWQISGHFPSQPFHRPIDPWKGNLQNGHFVYKEHPKDLSLNYWQSLEWLRDLRELKNENARLKSRELYQKWIDENSKWSPESWTPYLTSKRLSNTILCYGSFADTGGNDFQDGLLKIFAIQARCLELDLRLISSGHNKISALVGIIAGRVCLTPVKSEIVKAIRLIIDEIKKYINSEGMHISRQPQLQIETLRTLVEVRSLALSSTPSERNVLDELIYKMTTSAKIYCHNDGSIGNFNGACNFSLEKINETISKTEFSVRNSSRISKDGMAKIISKNSSILLDCGNVKRNWPNWQAGTLSFEFCHGKQLIIINSGYLSNNPNWSKALKGTFAHSTLTIDNRNSSSINFGNNFIQTAKIVESYIQKVEDGILVFGKHNGYFKSHGIYHERKILINKDGNAIIGEDTLSHNGNPGLIAIEGILRFHIHPSVKASKLLSENVLLKTTSGLAWIFKSNSAGLKIEDSIYITDSKPVKCQQIVIVFSLKNLQNSGSLKFNWELFKNVV